MQNKKESFRGCQSARYAVNRYSRQTQCICLVGSSVMNALMMQEDGLTKGFYMFELRAKPIELKEANEYVAQLHRHHDPVHRDKFRIACIDSIGNMHGVIQAGRPVSRVLDDGVTLEVVRCCTDGTKNVCSFLYSRMARIAKEMGYKKIITYILETEDGTSLKASGWNMEHITQGNRSLDCKSRPRQTTAPTCAKQRWIKYL